MILINADDIKLLLEDELTLCENRSFLNKFHIRLVYFLFFIGSI